MTLRHNELSQDVIDQIMKYAGWGVLVAFAFIALVVLGVQFL